MSAENPLTPQARSPRDVATWYRAHRRLLEKVRGPGLLTPALWCASRGEGALLEHFNAYLSNIDEHTVHCYTEPGCQAFSRTITDTVIAMTPDSHTADTLDSIRELMATTGAYHDEIRFHVQSYENALGIWRTACEGGKAVLHHIFNPSM